MANEDFGTGFRQAINPKLFEIRRLRVTGLPAVLRLPAGPAGLVILAHGGGSGRAGQSGDDQMARALAAAGFGTLLLDLVTTREAEAHMRVSDVGLLAARLLAGMECATTMPEIRGLPLGLFGAGNGAAAALVAANSAGERLAAVVARNARPDMACGVLDRLRTPVLLLVGDSDGELSRLNREALAILPGPCALKTVPDTAHRFAEPKAVEAVTSLAGSWFARHLPSHAPLPSVPGAYRKGYPG